MEHLQQVRRMAIGLPLTCFGSFLAIHGNLLTHSFEDNDIYEKSEKKTRQGTRFFALTDFLVTVKHGLDLVSNLAFWKLDIVFLLAFVVH